MFRTPPSLPATIAPPSLLPLAAQSDPAVARRKRQPMLERCRGNPNIVLRDRFSFGAQDFLDPTVLSRGGGITGQYRSGGSKLPDALHIFGCPARLFRPVVQLPQSGRGKIYGRGRGDPRLRCRLARKQRNHDVRVQKEVTTHPPKSFRSPLRWLRTSALSPPGRSSLQSPTGIFPRSRQAPSASERTPRHVAAVPGSIRPPRPKSLVAKSLLS